jgi:hypothetical protein
MSQFFCFLFTASALPIFDAYHKGNFEQTSQCEKFMGTQNCNLSVTLESLKEQVLQIQKEELGRILGQLAQHSGKLQEQKCMIHLKSEVSQLSKTSFHLFCC